MRKFYILIFTLFFLGCTGLKAQRKITTLGLQVKPIFPLSFVGTGKDVTDSAGVHIVQELNGGFCAGMVIRHGFSDLLAIETAINYVKRTYNLNFSDENFSESSSFRIIGYEIPVSFLVYIQLGEQTFMNASMGPSLDMFASDVQSFEYYYRQVSLRHHIFQPSLNANLGWEYRTLKSGYIYAGISYHRPFSYIYATRIEYDNNGKVVFTENKIQGSYLTIDLRYFFHAEPEKKEKK